MLVRVKRDLICVKRDLVCVKRDLACVKRDLDARYVFHHTWSSPLGEESVAVHGRGHRRGFCGSRGGATLAARLV
jgi:hypothetical protein